MSLTSSTATYRLNLQVDAAYVHRVHPGRTRAAARAALRQQTAAPGELTIRIAGDDLLQELNRDFLGQNSPTDVISFPSEAVDPESGLHYLGDIAISYPRAREQARTSNHPIWAELQLLVVHGVLHLLGHDHADSLEKDRMWAAQAEILAKLKTPISRLPSGE
jgi:probable rRNA maturation factor